MGDPRAAALVGRDRELASLAAGLDAHRDGPVVVVAGPAGIGKSALLACAGNRAAAAGALVLAGAATEFEAAAGLAVLTAALSPLVVALTDDDRCRLGTDLAALLPAGTACGSDGGVDPLPAAGATRGLGDDRYRLGRAVAALLRRAAADRPVLLVLEDVHWADVATFEVVIHLLRGRVPGLLLVLSHRTGLLDPGLRRALAATVRPDVDLRLELGPLPRAAADALLGAAVAPARRAELYAGSGGNPFHLLALARHGGADGPLPANVVDALHTEIVALAAPVRRLLEGAAVVGDPFDAGSAAAAAGLPAVEALDAVDALVAVDLVRVTEHPHRFGFRHPLVRRAVYELTGPQRRAVAHTRLDAAIATAGGSVVDRAPHLAASAHRGDTDATALLGEAATLVSARSPATAARWLRAALDLLTPAAPERPGVLLALAKALRTSGRLTQSRAALDELAALLPDGPGRADVLTLAANLDHLLGRHAEAGALLTSALAALPDRCSPAAARLLLALCSVGMHTCDYRWMRETAAEATAIARTLGDPALLAAALARLATAEYHVADVPAARAACAEVERLTAALDERALARRIDAVAWLGWAQWFVEHYAVAEYTFTVGRDVTRRRGLGFVLPELLAGRALTLLHRGRLVEAGEEATDARDAAELTGSGLALAMAVGTRADVAVLRGDVAAARAEATEALAGFEPGDRAARLLCSPALADALLAAGDPAGARRTLLVEGGGAELRHVEGAWRPRWYEILTLSALAEGDRPGAENWAARAAATAAGSGLDGRTATALRAWAAVGLARGDAPPAADAAGAAATLFAGIGSPVEEARAHVLAGRALGVAGRTDDAVRTLRHAHAAASAAGAGLVRDHAARALRALGRRATTGTGTLTDRERAIATMAAAGRTNREIAARLVLSERTVEGHLARARAKLGAPSRAALSAALAANTRSR